MDAILQSTVGKIHQTPHKVVLVTTGAGTMAQAWLFGVAGASRTMLEAQVPYSRQSFIDLIGREPDKYVSGKAARLLAGNALRRAGQLAGSVQYPISAKVPLIGVSCTGAIATDRPKKGLHHAYVVVWTESEIVQHYIQLDKDQRSRLEEEDLVSRIVLNAVASACGINDQVSLPLRETDHHQVKTYSLSGTIEQLLNQEIKFVGIYSHGKIKTKGINPQLLLPGSFNPLHVGHTQLAQTAQKLQGSPVAFEISAFNVDKPPLDKQVILKRATQFAGHHPIYITNAPTFVEKSRLFPHTTFVVGYDTAERILMPKYYQGSLENMNVALSEVRSHACRFLVAGRMGNDGVFDSATDLIVPDQFSDLFEPIPDDLFREDISSSEIRKHADSIG